MAEEILRVENLDVAYGETQVLFEVSLKANRKESVAIVGRNGAGKTTLLKTISGFIRPLRGKVIYNGRDVTRMPSYERARLGIRYVTQEKKVFSSLTVEENLKLALYGAGLNKGLEEAYKYFPKLKTLKDGKAGTLSGGERQMLLLARAFISNPELLLIDEPTEGLAPSIVAQLAEVLASIKERTTIILVEQNLPLIANIADRVYIMKEGRIVHEVQDKKEIKTLEFMKHL